MTALDAVAMGVPVVSLAGRTICSRVAAGCLTALDLAEFIAFDEKAYDRIAVAAVKNLDSLMRLRGELRQRLMSSAIGDSRRYAGAVEAAYRDAWRRACVDATA
jgi:predicted O-linked N-acetylglucosamine transferase (SPINDLY family)